MKRVTGIGAYFLKQLIQKKQKIGTGITWVLIQMIMAVHSGGKIKKAMIALHNGVPLKTTLPTLHQARKSL